MKKCTSIKWTPIFRGNKEKKVLYCRYRIDGLERTFKLPIEGQKEHFNGKLLRFELRGNYEQYLKEKYKKDNEWLSRFNDAWNRWMREIEAYGITHFTRQDLVKNEEDMLFQANGDALQQLTVIGDEEMAKVSEVTEDDIIYKVSATYIDLLNGKDDKVTPSTLRAYTTHIKIMCEWLKSNNLDSFKYFNVKTIQEYIEWMERKGKSKSTVKLTLSSVKQLAKLANAKGYITEDNYLTIKAKEFDITKEITTGKRIALTDEEIDLLWTFDGSDSLNKTRDILLMSVFTLQRISDVSGLDCSPTSTTAQLIERQGNYVIQMTQRKTTKQVSIPLLDDRAIEILKRNNYIIPSYETSHYNRRVKTLCKACGGSFLDNVTITTKKNGRTKNTTVQRYELVTSHVGRRSGISSLLNEGIDSTTVAKVSGHTSVEMVNRYFTATSTDVAFNLFGKVKK